MSTLHCFCSGELLRDPERKTSSNGNPFVSALLRVDTDMVLSLTAFDTTVADRLASLKKGSALACSGRLQARPYQDKDGGLRAGLSVVVTELMSGAMPPTKAAPRTRSDRSQRPAAAAAGGGGEPFDDELPEC